MRPQIGLVSQPARQALEGSRFAAQQLVYEAAASFAFRRWLHQSYPLVSLAAGSKYIIRRSREHGSWRMRVVSPYVTALRDDGPPVDTLPALPPDAARLVLRPFLERAEEVLLMTVPAPRVSAAQGKEMAGALGLRHVSVPPMPLSVSDGSHLARGSTQRYTRAFIEAVERVMPPAREGEDG